MHISRVRQQGFRHFLIHKQAADMKDRKRFREQAALENWSRKEALDFILTLLPKALGGDVDECLEAYSRIRMVAEQYEASLWFLEMEDPAGPGETSPCEGVAPEEIL